MNHRTPLGCCPAGARLPLTQQESRLLPGDPLDALSVEMLADAWVTQQSSMSHDTCNTDGLLKAHSHRSD